MTVPYLEDEIVHQVWKDAWIFDTKRRIGYQQALFNQTIDSLPHARYGCNAMLGMRRERFHYEDIDINFFSAPDNTTIYYFGGE